MNDIKIDWKKYVDKIYCLTLAGKNKNKLYSELKRVDILDSGIYYETEFIKSPIYEKLCNSCYTFLTRDNGYISEYNYIFDITLNEYYFMKHAQANNYDRILIIQDDCVFLKNKQYIVDILETSLKELDKNNSGLYLGQLYYVHYPFYNIGFSSVKTFFYENKSIINNCISYDINKSAILGGAAFNIYCKDAYEYYIKNVENFDVLYEDDNYNHYLENNINVYFNETPVCIQYKDIFIHINWFYLYNADIYDDFLINFDKEDFLNTFADEYKREVINGTYVLLNLTKKYYIDYFNQINMLVFNNELNIHDFIHG